MFSDFSFRLRALFKRTAVERDLDEELQFHLDRQAEAYEKAGLDRTEALRRARGDFGGVDQIREEYRDALGVRLVDDARRDVRFAVRSLRATPVITAVAILSLALGVGANTTIFSLINGLVLRTLPVRQPEQLALVAVPGGSSDRFQVWSHPVWEQIDQRPGLFGGAFAWSTPRFNLATSGETESIDGLLASGGFFDVLGVRPILGRTFSAADDRSGGGPDGAVAVISYRLWQQRFAGAGDVIGRALSVERVPFTIIGVTPPDFSGVDVGRAFDVALPLNTEPLLRGRDSLLDQRDSRWLSIMVRLRPGQSIDDASRTLQGIQSEIRDATAPTVARGYLAEPFTLVDAATGRSALRRSYERPLLMLLVVVALVLLTACANVANLQLARTTARQHEFGVRLALGASRWQLARPLLAESMVLSVTGTALGLLFTRWSSPLLIRQLSTQTNTVVLDVPIDWRVLLFAVTITAITTLLFGVAPAIRASCARPADDMKAQLRGVRNSSPRRGVASSLLVVQVALSLVLVIAAGLFIRTLTALVNLDPGFDRDGVLVVNVNAVRASVEPEQRFALYQRALEAVRRIPGVGAAAISLLTPVSGASSDSMMEVVGETAVSEPHQVSVHSISPGWFATYRTPVLTGRDFSDADRRTAPNVAIVNQEFARMYLEAANPIGRVIRESSLFRKAPGPPLEVVGVVANALYVSLREPAPPTVYIPMAQAEGLRGASPYVSLSVHGAVEASLSLTRPIVAAITEVNPDLSLTIRPLSDRIDAALNQERVIALLSGFFGALALLLAGLGLYGVTSYAVASRRAEIGIRMALGAAAGQVVRLVMSRVAVMVAIGLAVGTTASFWASRFVSTLVWGLEPRDTATFVCAMAMLTLVAALAAWLPARRAARIDPAVVLRES